LEETENLIGLSGHPKGVNIILLHPIKGQKPKRIVCH
jgi:hypothetical protein